MGFVVKLVLVLAVVAAGVWGYMTFMKPAPQAVETAQQQQPVTETPKAATPDDGGISTRGSTAAALSSDLKTLDAQADSAQSASADMDASATDKPIDQTE